MPLYYLKKYSSNLNVVEVMPSSYQVPQYVSIEEKKKILTDLKSNSNYSIVSFDSMLDTVDFLDDNVRNEFYNLIFQVVKDNKYITSFDLTTIALKNEHVKPLIDAIQNNKTAKFYDLSCNLFNQEALDSLKRYFETRPDLSIEIKKSFSMSGRYASEDYCKISNDNAKDSYLSSSCPCEISNKNNSKKDKSLLSDEISFETLNSFIGPNNKVYPYSITQNFFKNRSSR